MPRFRVHLRERYGGRHNDMASDRHKTTAYKDRLVDAPGLVNFIPAVAYHFCLNEAQLACSIDATGALTLVDL